MTHRNRWGRLERGAQLYNERQADRIVPRLQAMRVAAERTRQQAASGLTSVLQQLSDCYDLTEAQVRLASFAAG